MNLLNALGFIVLGTVMHALPRWAPSWVHRSTGNDPASTSALWLQVMGFVVIAIGSSYCLNQAWVRFPAWWANLRPVWQPARPVTTSARNRGSLPAGQRATV
jgi:hypothetical protein